MKKIVVTKWRSDVYVAKFEGREGNEVGPTGEVALGKFLLTNATELGIEVEYVDPYEKRDEKKT